MEKGTKSKRTSLEQLGLSKVANAHWNLSAEELIDISIKNNLGKLTNKGCLAVDTGEFTGRAPKDRFVVYDDITKDTVWWDGPNHKFDSDNFDSLQNKLLNYLEGKDVYIRDAYACADENYRLNIRVINELPWTNLFAHNMFLRLKEEEILDFEPDWTLICATNFRADARVDGTRQHNFAILNFTKKTIIIGGTAYTGEIKKGIFSILN